MKGNTPYRSMIMALLFFAAFPAFADPKPQVDSANAGENCTESTAVQDTPIRKRPLAVVNEGTTKASFVNCFFRVDRDGDGVELFAVVLNNRTASAMTINCLGVIGVDNGHALYLPKSTTLQPGQRKAVEWRMGPDNGGDRWETNVGLQCLLPPGGAMNETIVAYQLAERYD